jgi:hypothetical protein
MKYINLKFAKCLGTTIFLMISGVFILTTNVRAQSGTVSEIQIPFDFVVKGQTFSAGKYRIERLDQANLDTLILKNAVGKTLSILQTQRFNSEAPSNESRLTFHRHGDIYFLDSIRASGENYGSKLSVPKSDRKRQRLSVIAEVVSLTGN